MLREIFFCGKYVSEYKPLSIFPEKRHFGAFGVLYKSLKYIYFYLLFNKLIKFKFIYLTNNDLYCREHF